MHKLYVSKYLEKLIMSLILQSIFIEHFSYIFYLILEFLYSKTMNYSFSLILLSIISSYFLMLLGKTVNSIVAKENKIVQILAPQINHIQKTSHTSAEK